MDVKPGYKQTEVGVIPKDWEVKSAYEFAVIKTGPFGTLLKASEYSERDGVPLISVGEIREGSVRITDHTPRVPEVVTQRLPQFILRRGDIVFGRKGGVERSALIRQPQEGWFLGSDGISIRPSQDCHDEYLALQFRSARVQGWLLQNAIGTTMPSLNQEILRNVVIPLPPTKTEQEAIAEALSDADALIESLEQLLTKKRQIKQGAMQELLTGKKRLPGFSGEWETKHFGEVFKRLNGKAHQIQTSEYSTHGLHPVIDQGQDAITAFSDRTDKLFECLAGGVIVFGDHTRIVKFIDMNFLIGADGIQLLTTQGHAVTKFFFYQLLTKDIPNTGYNRHFKFLQELTFKVPASEEQTAIATILFDMDAEIAALETKLAKARQIKQGMMQELLTGRIRLI